MKALTTTILFFTIYVTGFTQTDSLQIDTVFYYLVEESPVTSKPINVYEIRQQIQYKNKKAVGSIAEYWIDGGWQKYALKDSEYLFIIPKQKK